MSGFWPKASPSPDVSPIVGKCGGRLVSFNFQGLVDGVPYESAVPAAMRQQFMELFGREIAKIEKWFLAKRWLKAKLSARPTIGTYAPQQVFELQDVDLEVAVSGDFQIARSLVQASVGRRGAIEFPAARVASEHADVMHELSHVYFPNGNRLLAEGFAVYIQNRIGANSAYPDFGMNLHEAASAFVCSLDPSSTPDPHIGLEKFNLRDLDKVPTPSRLELSTSPNQSMDPGEAAYKVAGSLVKFLIDEYGDEKFRRLFFETPLKPLRRDAGKPSRWDAVYGRSLGELEKEWKELIAALGIPRAKRAKRG